MIMNDLKICDLLHDWHEMALERAVLRVFVNDAAQEVNHSMEKENEEERCTEGEKRKKN